MNGELVKGKAEERIVIIPLATATAGIRQLGRINQNT
jgi:hypothetical protein